MLRSDAAGFGFVRCVAGDTMAGLVSGFGSALVSRFGMGREERFSLQAHCFSIRLQKQTIPCR
ncbi:hypothetical protein [Mesorhizobium sp. CN2-181]|uniref:hypothetical protein n=1 Tax=Mesorhizobium yinganensis TaxID=3157707 RepID=UPI0032B73DCE